MKNEDIYENLCRHNKLYPYYLEENEDDYDPTVKCFCDNCFYNRNKLALEILKLKEKLEKNGIR